MDTTYAKRSDGEIIKAKQGISKLLSFFCPGCNCEVYAATEGKKQRPHFRHKAINGNSGCSDAESYAHWITKELFAEHYENVTEFYLLIGIEKKCVHDVTCTKKSQFQINLKEKYPYIKVEKNHNGLRPDCLLYNDNGDKLYFEVHYTNKVSEAKIETKIPIIELHIVNEKDIDRILETGGFKTQQNTFFSEIGFPIVTLYNEKVLIPEGDYFFDCKHECINKVSRADNSACQQKNKDLLSRTNNEPSFNHEFIGTSKTIPDENQYMAIEYLSETVGRRDKYTKEKTLPFILGKCVDDYNKNHNKYKGRTFSENSITLLHQEDTFMFFSCNSVFFGVIRYESLWHVFYLPNYKNNDETIIFIDSVKEGRNIEETITQHFNIF